MNKTTNYKQTKNPLNETETHSLNIFIIIILLLTLLAPIIVAPYLLDNIFNLPKTLFIMAGAFVMIGIYCSQFFLGKPVKYSKAKTPAWLLLIVLLNFISFFYTQNYYYTNVAALMNISALTIFYFTSIYTDNSKSLWILEAIVLSGIIISIIAWLQYYNSPILPQWLKSSTKTTALIGNSNFLGAYLLFPLLALFGLMFLLKGKMRFIIAGSILFVLIALLFSKTRSALLGFSFALPIFLIFIKKIHRFSIKNYSKENPKQIIASIIIISCLFTTLWFVMPKHFNRDIKSRWNTRTLVQRLQFFSASLELLKENPFWGTGLWSYRNGVYRAQARILKKDPDFFKGKRTNKPQRVHNEYLETLNDGGIVAAVILLFFILIIMRHGLKVIRDPESSNQIKIIAATAFCIIIAIMVDAIFFFPFRINPTLFLTALILGLLEGIYLNSYELKSQARMKSFQFSPLFVCLIVLMLVSVFWHRAYKPLRAEMEHFKFLDALYHKQIKSAESHILNAIAFDPGHTRYHVYAGSIYINSFRNYSKANEFIDKSLNNFIGDNTLWGIYYMKGYVTYRMGSLFEAREFFQKSLYYNPSYEPSIKKLAELKNIFKNHDEICIKLR